MLIRTVIVATIVATLSTVYAGHQPAYALWSDDGDAVVTPGNGGGDDAFDVVTLVAESIQGTMLGAMENLSHHEGSARSGDAGTQTLDPMAGLGQFQTEEYCGWSELSSPLDPSNPAWEGNTSGDGSVRWMSCAILGPGTPGTPGNPEGRPVVFRFFSNAVLTAAPPPPDPEVIAERAIRQLRVPEPQIGAGPNRTKLAVNLWTWLWIDNPGPLSATAAAGGVSVTATATLASVTWSLGEPAPTGGPYAAGSPVTITCQGTGTPPPADYDWKAEPPCGHKYTWRSTKDRTRGTGTWPITATSNWNVTWQSNTGVSGSTTLSATGNDALDIGEYRIVLVQEPGG